MKHNYEEESVLGFISKFKFTALFIENVALSRDSTEPQ